MTLTWADTHVGVGHAQLLVLWDLWPAIFSTWCQVKSYAVRVDRAGFCFEEFPGNAKPQFTHM